MVPPVLSGEAALVANAPERDVKGFPWDSRIHASSKAKVADGSWRMRRGVDPAIVLQVEAELRTVATAPAATTAAQLPPWPFATSGADIAPLPMRFATLMQALPGAMTSGAVTTAQIDAACQAVGVPNLPTLAHREDLVPQVAATLGLA